MTLAGSGSTNEQIASLRHLLLFDQPERCVWHHFRRADGAWDSRELRDGVMELPELGGSISLDEIYDVRD